MLIEARFRRRAAAGESISELNRNVISQLSKIKKLWADGKQVSDVYFDAGTGESAATNLSACLVPGIKGAISYASRLPWSIVDKAISDDCLTLRFNSDSIDFLQFSTEVLPEIIKTFAPYRATIITDLERDLDDFEEIVEESHRTGLDIDGRDTVFRINTVNYFDNLMCIRAFGISADEVVKRLENSVDRVEKVADGAFMVVVRYPEIGEKLDALDKFVRNHFN